MIVITMARKLCGGTVAATSCRLGTGSLNIDACRIPLVGETLRMHTSDPSNRRGIVGRELWAKQDPDACRQAQTDSLLRTIEKGRWPANLLLSEQCRKDFDSQVPKASSRTQKAYTISDKAAEGVFAIGTSMKHHWGHHFGDDGPISRCFKVFADE